MYNFSVSLSPDEDNPLVDGDQIVVGGQSVDEIKERYLFYILYVGII